MKKVTVEGRDYEVIMEFPVLHAGWECDYVGYIVQKGLRPALVMSGHGKLYFAKKEHLKEKVNETREALIYQEKALSMID